MEGLCGEVLTADRLVRDILQGLSDGTSSSVAGLVAGPLSSPATSGAEQLGVAIVDCQNSTNFGKCHIKGATNVTLSPDAASCVADGKLDLLEWSETLRIHVAKGMTTFVLYNCSRSEQHLPTSGAIFAQDTHAGQGRNTEVHNVVAVMTTRLAEKGCTVFSLEGGLEAFRDRYPEWVWEVAPPEPVITKPFSLPTARGNVNHTPATGGGNSLGGRRRLSLHLDIRCPGPSPVELHRHDSINEIMQNLFLGDEESSMDISELRKRNITRILNVTPEVSNRFEGEMEYLQIKVLDGVDSLLGHLGVAVRFIDEGRQKGTGVLVHCKAGISRSATITIAYLMFTMGLTQKVAFRLVKEKRHKIDPKFYYICELSEYENRVLVRKGEV